MTSCDEDSVVGAEVGDFQSNRCRSESMVESGCGTVDELVGALCCITRNEVCEGMERSQLFSTCDVGSGEPDSSSSKNLPISMYHVPFRKSAVFAATDGVLALLLKMPVKQRPVLDDCLYR